MAKLVVFGAGDIARLAAYYFDNDSDHEVVSFTVDAAYKEAEEFCGRPLVAFEDLAKRYPPSDYKMFVALSYAKMNRVRSEKYAAAKEAGYELVSYVSSRCSYLTEPPGDNCFILEDNTVQPFVKLGNNITLWSGNHIGHDSVIEDHCFITSHVVVSGNCRIGPYCFLGVNATLRNSLTLARETLIGAGAAVMRDTTERQVILPPQPRLTDRTSDQLNL